MYQFLNDEITLEKLKDVEVQDLLGRDPVQVNLKEIMGYVKISSYGYWWRRIYWI